MKSFRKQRTLLMAIVSLALLSACAPTPTPIAPIPTLFMLPSAEVTSQPTAAPQQQIEVTSAPTQKPPPAVPSSVVADTTSIPITTIPSDTGDGCSYNSAFISDVSAPGQSGLSPGEAFTKIWRLENTGSCPWDENVQMVFLAGKQMGGELLVPTPEAAPGDQVDVSINLTAPRQPGLYTGLWQLQDPSGNLFGVRPVLSVVVEGVPSDAPVGGSPYAISGPGGCVLDSKFITDITIPDDSILPAGEPFTKTWRIQNSGTCDWGTEYRLVFDDGDQLGAPIDVTVAPTAAQGFVDISVPMTAPLGPGSFYGKWRLQTPDGRGFGIWPFVKIIVTGEPGDENAPQPTPIPTPQPAANTPTNDFDAYLFNITSVSRQIYLDGQLRGNRTNVFAKVGDSITDVWAHLHPIGNGQYALGNYSYLQSTINFFGAETAHTGNSFNNASLAAIAGWSTIDVLHTDHVSDFCSETTPIECEYIYSKPSVAIIMIGTNDANGAIPIDLYRGNLARMVEISMGNGVIPFLSTIPWSQWADEGAYNAVVVEIAQFYQVPWMDYHAAMNGLPNYGISDDGVHPSVPPGQDPTNFTPANLQFGHTLRNLLVLHALQAIWQGVMY